MSEFEPRSSKPAHSDARALIAEFEPLPRIGLLQAARRYWLLVVLPVLVVVPVVAVVASNRTPKYTAEARLMVGRLDLSSPGAISGFAQAAQTLASTYPLVLDADGIINSVAKQLKTTPGDVRTRLTASQVPSSAVVKIDATGSSPSQAADTANAASNALVAYLSDFNRANSDVTRLRSALQSAELAYQRAQSALPGVRHIVTLADQRKVAAAGVAKVALTGAASDYQTILLTQAVSSLLQPLTFAHGATSDRTSKLEISVLAALIAGLVIGVALALMRANMVARKALTAPTWDSRELQAVGVPSPSGPASRSEATLRGGSDSDASP